MSAYQAAARSTFNRLIPFFRDGGNYWRSGNTFDTLIDYVALYPEDDPGLKDIALNRYHHYVLNPNPPSEDVSVPVWYDDFGWWGIASLRATQLPTIFGSLVPIYAGIANYCWDTMNRNAPYVWQNASNASEDDQKFYAPYEPAVEGGVWNYIYSRNTILQLSHTPSNPVNPPDGLCSIQNTVTNGLYWILGSRMAKRYPNLDYLGKAAAQEYSFFMKWFQVADTNLSLLMNLEFGNNVVRERVSHYKSGLPLYRYEPRLAWTGDQGLVIGALTAYRALYGSVFPSYKTCGDYAQKILMGSRQFLAPQNILQAWTPGMSAPGGDDDDYNTGVGIFMRYVKDAWINDSVLRGFMQAGRYPDFIKVNADRAVTNPGSDVTSLTNSLATLVTAITMGL